jgi:hypothetical protein
MTVSAKAESFFERYKARSDTRHEKANLWHPYWLARLVQTTHNTSDVAADSALSVFED